MATYTNRVVWKGGHVGHTYCENGTDMEFSAPPALFGHPGVMTPEDAFMMAINTCVHMMVIWAAERFRLDLVAYECLAEGTVTERLDRTSSFTQVVLRPRVRVRGGTRLQVERSLAMARKFSTIADSVACEVVIEPDIEILPLGRPEGGQE